jgi:hypothetical protein
MKLFGALAFNWKIPLGTTKGHCAAFAILRLSCPSRHWLSNVEASISAPIIYERQVRLGPGNHTRQGQPPTVPLRLALRPTITHHPLTTNNLPASVLMSHSQITPASSSNFQLIIYNALEAYKKRTKNDLLAHPLAPQLQACDSPGAILAILQQQAQGMDQSRSDDRWTKWLDPTVNVLFAFSATLGTGVGLVCSRTSAI